MATYEFVRCFKCSRLERKDWWDARFLESRAGCLCGSRHFRKNFPGITLLERVKLWVGAYEDRSLLRLMALLLKRSRKQS